MSYTLDDIFNIINRRIQQQQQPQQQPPRYYRTSSPFPGFPAYGFSPYQNIYAGYGEDDDSEDGDYQPCYPAYYGNHHQFRNPQIMRPQMRSAQQGHHHRQQVHPSPHKQPQAQAPQQSSNQQHQQAQQAQQRPQDSGVSRSDEDAFVRLLQQMGIPVLHYNDGDDEKQEGAASAEPEGKRTSLIVAPGAKDAAEKKEVKEAETKASESAATSESTAAPSEAPAQPQPTRSHVSQFQEPRPKIELSQRNFRDTSIPYSPQTNIYESQESYEIVLAIPGASIKNLDIDFHPSTNELVIKGKVPETSGIFGTNAVPTLKIDEIRTGLIERRVKFPVLPKIVDELIKAKYMNGLLTIKVPKNLESEKQKAKRKVTIEDVPDEELLWEEKGGIVE